jgi:hypothetical protein
MLVRLTTRGCTLGTMKDCSSGLEWAGILRHAEIGHF